MTEQTKHTPGPWRYCMFADCMPDFKIKAGDRGLAKVNYFAGNPENSSSNDIAEGESNAQLIAAAPELLEACKALASVRQDVISTCIAGQIPGWQKLDRAFEQARAAIAKAEGSL